MSVSKSVLPIIGQRAKKRDLYKYKRAHTSLDAVLNDARKAAMDFLLVLSQCVHSPPQTFCAKSSAYKCQFSRGSEATPGAFGNSTSQCQGVDFQTTGPTRNLAPAGT